MVDIAVAACMLGLFGLGFIAGQQYGWDRCWRDLTKDDSWRKKAPHVVGGWTESI